MIASQPKQSVGKHNSGSFSKTQSQLFSLPLPPPAYKCHSHKSKMTILLLARARCWAKNNVLSSGLGKESSPKAPTQWSQWCLKVTCSSTVTWPNMAEPIHSAKSKHQVNQTLFDWLKFYSNNNNNLFYIMPQQQLYELLELYRSTNAIKHTSICYLN